MKAIVLWQPWASLVALGVKTIETRSWSTKYRGPLAIHAAAKKPARVWARHDRPALYDDIQIERCLDIQEDGNNPGQFAYDWVGPLGAVVATCTLVDVVPIKDADDELAEVWQPHVALTRGGDCHLGLWRERSEDDGPMGSPTWVIDNIEDQLPYGDFTPGRFAWLLDNIIRLPEPPAARGGQRIWNW